MTIRNYLLLIILTLTIPTAAVIAQTNVPSVKIAPVDQEYRSVDNAKAVVVKRGEFFDEVTVRDRDFEKILSKRMFSQLIDQQEFFDVVTISEVRDLIDEDRFKEQMTEEKLFDLIDIEDLDDFVGQSTFYRDDDITDKRRFVRDYIDEPLFEDAINQTSFFTVIDSSQFFDDDVLDRDDLMDYVEASNISDKDEYNEDNVIQKLRQRGIFTVVPYNELFNVVDDFDEFRQAVEDDAFMLHISLEQFIEVLDERDFWIVVDFTAFLDETVDEDDLLDELDEDNFFRIIPTYTLLWNALDDNTRDFFDTNTIDKNAFFDNVRFNEFFTYVSKTTFFNQIDTDDFFRREVNDDGFIRFILPTAGEYEVFTRARGFYMDHKSIKVDWASELHIDVLLTEGNADRFGPPPDDGGDGDNGDPGDDDNGDDNGNGGGNGDPGDDDNGTDNTTDPLTDIDLTRLQTPSIVQKGSSYNITVTAVNNGDTTRKNLKLVIEAFNNADQSETFTLKPGDTITRTLTTNVPSTASGPEQFKATVREGTTVRDEIINDVTVSKVRTYFTVEPSTVDVGSRAQVNGRITNYDGTPAETTASLYLGNTRVTTLQPDKQGYFTAYVTPERIGRYNVILDGSGLFFSRKLKAEGSISITDMTSPSTLREGEQLETCADIAVPGTATGSVAFIVGNTTIETRQVTNTGQRCFSTYPIEGTHSIVLKGSIGTKTVKKESTVTVTPDNRTLQIIGSVNHTITEGTNDTVDLSIKNPSVSGKELTARLTDLPSHATTHNRSYYIQGNSTRYITLPLSINISGRTSATAELHSGGDVTTKQLQLVIQQKNDPGPSGGFFSSLFEKEYTSLFYLIYLTVALLLILGAAYIYRRMTGPSYLEPLN